jgi:hypothetical protein
MPISVYIDNNVWDLLFELKIDLSTELPDDEFRLCLTREAEFETPPMNEQELKPFLFLGFMMKTSQHQSNALRGLIRVCLLKNPKLNS